ncbi:MAG: ketol-acid reductoisomerase [Armatimonadota bacterium]|nr:ketol-acid reductoisomerase [Armatimonadota bacterium]MDR7518973.1 ketol-acid reductoisomerase [Armatimonadota bacterium]MDR7548556.1 ketol-acid reductoisomerase [Armatimonadota bacterium]
MASHASAPAAAAENTFTSAIFPVETLDLAGRRESFVRGGRHLFPLLPKALAGIRTIGVIGWGSQAPAQAMNLRESLEGTPITVVVGLREGSGSFEAARQAGFTEASGTLGDMFEVIERSDLVLLLIADAAQAALYPRIFQALRPGATLGLSHGFLVGHLRNMGDRFPPTVNVIGVCPKGMGPSVRRLYEQGRETNGAGINTSFAVEQDIDGRATEVALAWSVALGAPYTFKTTLTSEYLSDIFGERAILLGAVWGIVESLYRRYIAQGYSEQEAFVHACESITGPIAQRISREGLRAVYDGLSGPERADFERAYAAAYTTTKPLMVEIYDEVASGNELRSVILAGERLAEYPIPPIEGSRMWQVGADVRRQRGRLGAEIHAFTAGTFLGTMMAQVDVLVERGHPYSEIANESVIEAVDSLLPYMHARGVAYMVDNCSTTARLGTRKWGPRFEALLSQIAYPAADAQPRADAALIEAFRAHPIHGVLATLAAMRPPVDIAVR